MENDKEREAFEKWFRGEQGKPYIFGYEIALAAWQARAALAHSEESVDSVTVPRSEWEAMRRDAERWQRLRIMGCAPYGTPQLDRGTVLRFQSLDEFTDKDIAQHPSRGEAEKSTGEDV